MSLITCFKITFTLSFQANFNIIKGLRTDKVLGEPRILQIEPAKLFFIGGFRNRRGNFCQGKI